MFSLFVNINIRQISNYFHVSSQRISESCQACKVRWNRRTISSLVLTCFEMRDLFIGGTKIWNEGLTGLVGPISSQLRNTFNNISILDSFSLTILAEYLIELERTLKQVELS